MPVVPVPMRFTTLIGLACIAMAPPACKYVADDVESKPPNADEGEAWKNTPTSMRIYPSSRFARFDGRLVLEARLELFDDMGDSTKGVGDLVFELHEAAGGRAQGIGKRLYVWDVRLMTMQHQRSYYDAVLRAYLFRLTLEDFPPGLKRTVLNVVLHVHQGPRLPAQGVIPVNNVVYEQESE